MNRILIATDAWPPQVNGVATTYRSLIPVLRQHGYKVKTIAHSHFRTIPTIYPDVRLALCLSKTIGQMIDEFNPDAIHIATEGTIGLQTKRYCDKHNIRYTTAFHTKYAEYAKAHLHIPLRVGWSVLRWYHAKSQKVLVPTTTLLTELDSRGFRNLALWTRGINPDIFHPRKFTYPAEHRPIQMYVGRVSVEKNIEAFLQTEVPGTKYVIGDGPELPLLRRKYPNVIYKGMLHGMELAEAYANADVFVFPSKTDTFGIVILEALASGVPVAAYPVTGPIDILTDPSIGFMNENLEVAIRQALEKGDRQQCYQFAKDRSWSNVMNQFITNLIPTR